MMKVTATDRLIKSIIGCAYRVHNTLGSGFLEKVYENALRIELEAAGLRVQQQAAIPVHDNGQIVGEDYADLMVEEYIIIELKAIQNPAKEHETQLVHYLTATRIDNGLLINFAPPYK